VRGDDESVWLWREMGWWLADHGQPGESMAAMGAGAIPYYSNRETIDLLGLNDKHIARLEVENMGSGVAGHEKKDPDYVLNQRKPTYIPGIWTEYFGGPQALKDTGLYTREEVTTRYGRRIVLWKRVS
jgi:arabinofuranosyltransferase